MAYEMVMPYHLHMPSYFLETFTEYPGLKVGVKRLNYIILRRTLDGNKKIVLSGI